MSMAKRYRSLLLIMLCSVYPLLSHSDTSATIEMEVLSALSFGFVVPAEHLDGNIELDPHTGRTSSSGGAKVLGGRPQALHIALKGLPFCEFDVLLPQSVALQGSTGKIMMTDLQVDGDTSFDRFGHAVLRIGGTIALSPASHKGSLSGQALVSVEYKPQRLQNRECQMSD